MSEDRLEQMWMACPLVCDWCKYKGEVYYAGLNWDRSLSANRLMVDLSYCATAYLNNSVIKTVAWDPLKFTDIGKFAR